MTPPVTNEKEATVATEFILPAIVLMHAEKVAL
jgi:hypothetical protein